MNCPRCEGLMVGDHLYHHRESLYVLAIWRCVNCGATFDPISIRNRYQQEHPEMDHTSKAA